jgi:GDP-L-fucose synthase
LFYQGQKVLVTGGSGFIGSHLVQTLLDRGAFIRVPIHNNPIAIDNPQIETVPGDLTNPLDCMSVMDGIDYVFHAAGATGAAGISDYQLMEGITLNLVLTANILQAAWAKGIKKILIFGSSTGYPPYNHPVKEEEMWRDAPHPSYLGYGWMRRYFEKLGEFVSGRSQCTVVIIRPSAVYGPGDNVTGTANHVIPALIQRAVNGENPFIVWGNGNEVRDFIHVSDFSRGCLLAMEKCLHFDSINIGAGKGVTIRQTTEIILDVVGLKGIPVIFDKTKPVTIPYRTIDTEKAKTLLGFTPRISLEDGIKDLVRWYQKFSSTIIS